MLKLLSLFPFISSSVNGVSDVQIVLTDDHPALGTKRVRASWRGADDESSCYLPGCTRRVYRLCGCDTYGTVSWPGVNDCNLEGNMDSHRQQKSTAGPGKSQVGGMTTSYNSTTGILTVKNRGGYGINELQTVDLQGPGTLYTVHLDVEPRDDFIKLTGSDGRTNFLTGNYSSCVRHSTGLETRYMDNNLSPENQYSEDIGDYHTTEETHNEENDLCHNILTGKVLMPAPIEIAEGVTETLTWSSDGNNSSGDDSPTDHTRNGDFYEGFELVFQYNDLYTADVITTQEFVCVLEDWGSGTQNNQARSSQITDWVTTDVFGLPPSVPSNHVYFQDKDLNKLKIDGTIEIESPATRPDGSANDDVQSYLITLEKYEPAGRWGYILGQLANADEFSQTARIRDDLPYGETTVYGPSDTEGHNGADEPYFPTGGSTGTSAPTLLGGGPAGARVFNKHGDVIPGSARGMHPDYQTAEELIDVQEWTCNCQYNCIGVLQKRCLTDIARTSGELNGMGLIPSQGSPPAPMYQLRVRACRDVDADGKARHCDLRHSTVIQLVDIAEYEPTAVFYGDLDPKTRVLQGEITVTSPPYAMGLRGYRAYPTSTGSDNLPLIWSNNESRDAAGLLNDGRQPNPQFIVVLDKHCPPRYIGSGTGAAGNPGDTYNTDQERYCASAGANWIPNGGFSDPQWCKLAEANCGNDSPFSPKCLGKSCPSINILAGSQGEWYISRYDNNGNAQNPQTRLHGINDDPLNNNLPQTYTSNTAQRNYSHNEFAQIYLPQSGWLTPIMMDVNTAVDCTPEDTACEHATNSGDGDKLELYQTPNVLHAVQSNLVTASLSQYIDLWTPESVVEWSTDAYDTAHGWTLIFQPNYPEISMNEGTPMAQGASGLRIVPVYHANPSLTPLNDGPSDFGSYNNGEYGEACATCICVGCAVEGTDNTDAYVETYDWLVPNVTCTPTTMHCPLPNVWAHINYTTPSLYPEPAEGSCLQQKSGTSSLSGCSEKMNLDERWYSANSPTTSKPGMSQQNTNEEDNSQMVAADSVTNKHANWAGNCGDASSYFWFEKIACGSTRTFLTDRSLIEDFVQLTPTWEDIQQILDLYYTTKAPLAGRDQGDGFTFITPDYHIAPVLPPKVNCSCMSSMDAYASLLSVVSKTPQPGAPITLDPEVLNSGTSKIVATLRMYQDPTYSIPASSVAPMPIVVTRFYLEVSTKFTRNRITISDCHASNLESLLNQTTSLKPRMNYCDNSTFDTRSERSPNGVTHMDRISMKKFKFQSTTDVFMQCKMRACAQQPCGICTGTGNAYRELQDVDLAPVEGEMYAPPFNLKVAGNDKNAMVFDDTVPTFRAAPAVPTVYSPTAAIGAVSSGEDSSPVTNKPITIRSDVVLSGLSADWAVNNRHAIEDTIRGTLSLQPNEDLVVTSILKLGRRSLQQAAAPAAGTAAAAPAAPTGGVKIEFIIGLNDSARAGMTERVVNQLSTGSAALVMKFSAKLDSELAKRGQPPVNLPATSLSFSAPVQQLAAGFSAATRDTDNEGWEVSQNNIDNDDDSKDDNGSGMMMMMFVGALCLGSVALLLWYRMKQQQLAAVQYGGEHYGADAGKSQKSMYNSKIASYDQQWVAENNAAAGWGGDEWGKNGGNQGGGDDWQNSGGGGGYDESWGNDNYGNNTGNNW